MMQTFLSLRGATSVPRWMLGKLPLVQLSSSGKAAGNPCLTQQQLRLAALLLQQQIQQQMMMTWH
jgi:hypothetical protein